MSRFHDVGWRCRINVLFKSRSCLKYASAAAVLVLALGFVRGGVNADGFVAAPRTLQQALDFSIYAQHHQARWLRHEDDDYAGTMTLGSLFAGSTLVARVRFDRVLGSLPDGSGPFRTDFEQITLLQVLRKSGGDSQLMAGNQIVASDMLGKDGSEFLDDLPLNVPGDYLVFLQKLPNALVFGGREIVVHKFTTHFISRWRINRNGSLTPMSVRETHLRKAMDGILFPELVKMSTAHSGIESITEVLTAHGLGGKRGLARYDSLIARAPWIILHELGFRDMELATTMLKHH